ncbi:hypothetical protein ZWY2020_008178 [Hordeum vulgare]|nr:hypothetical protein ZWY2020_008178 [Hordeum vulgare]
MAAAETSGSSQPGAPGRWSLHGKTVSSPEAPAGSGVRWWRSLPRWGRPCTPAPGRRRSLASASRSGRPGASASQPPSATSPSGSSGAPDWRGRRTLRRQAQHPRK